MNQPVNTNPSSGQRFWVTDPSRSCLRLRGTDAQDFFHRMSTAQVLGLQIGQSALAVLTDKRGRLIDLVQVLVCQKEELLLVTSAAVDVRAWLDGFLFSEDVEIVESDPALQIQRVFGEALLEDIAEICGTSKALEPWAACAEKEGDEVVGWWMRSFDLVTSNGQEIPSAYWLAATGRPSKCGHPQGTLADLEKARVAAGEPSAPSEINDRVNPLELGLDDAISWTKGCYIGQEVISRIDTRDKRKNELVLFRHSGSVCVGDALSFAGGASPQNAEITSATDTHAMAMVQRGFWPVGGKGQAGKDAVEVERIERPAEQSPHD